MVFFTRRQEAELQGPPGLLERYRGWKSESTGGDKPKQAWRRGLQPGAPIAIQVWVEPGATWLRLFLYRGKLVKGLAEFFDLVTVTCPVALLQQLQCLFILLVGLAGERLNLFHASR